MTVADSTVLIVDDASRFETDIAIEEREFAIHGVHPLAPLFDRDALAASVYASPHLPGVAGRQWRGAYGAEGTHAARIHPDHAEYLRRRDDGINAGGAWEIGKAGDGALMDVSGRQRIAFVH